MNQSNLTSRPPSLPPSLPPFLPSSVYLVGGLFLFLRALATGNRPLAKRGGLWVREGEGGREGGREGGSFLQDIYIYTHSFLPSLPP